MGSVVTNFPPVAAEPNTPRTARNSVHLIPSKKKNADKDMNKAKPTKYSPDEFFATSDPHFFHSRIIQLCKRPYLNNEDMNDALVANWNRVVPVGATVKILGDVSMGGFHRDIPKLVSILNSLNGYKDVILGNHEDDLMDALALDENCVRSVKHYDEVLVGNQHIVLFHYACRTFNKDFKGAWHLFGHTHNMMKPYGKSFDVGVDSVANMDVFKTSNPKNDYRPLSFYEIKKVMDNRPMGRTPGSMSNQKPETILEEQEA